MLFVPGTSTAPILLHKRLSIQLSPFLIMALLDTVLVALLHNWPVVLSLGLVAYFVSNYLNRGLQRYPGPLLASLTDWWRFWDVWGKRPEVTHIKLHEKYGDVVRLGPNTLSFADPKALKTIYGLNKGFTKACFRPGTGESVEEDRNGLTDGKQSEFYPVQQSVAGSKRLPSLFSTTSEPFHQQLRRSVNSAFSMSSLVQYEPFVDSTSELFLKQTAKLYTSAPCDFARWLQFYAFDVIGEITYSKRHGFLEENKDIDGIVGYISSLFNYVAPVRSRLRSDGLGAE